MREAPARRCRASSTRTRCACPGTYASHQGPLLPVRAREKRRRTGNKGARSDDVGVRDRRGRASRATTPTRRRRSKCRCGPRSAPSSRGAQTERWAHGNAGRPRSVARAPRHRGPGRRASRAVSRARRVRRRESALERSRSRRRARRLRATASGRRRWFHGQDGAAPARCAPATADDGRLHWCRRAVVRALDFFSDLDDDDDDDDDVPFVEDYAALARERRETESARARPEDASTPHAAAAAPRQDTSASIGADAYARTAGASPAESLDGVAWLAPLHCSADSAPTTPLARLTRPSRPPTRARRRAQARVLGARARRRGRGARPRARAASSACRARRTARALCSSTRSSAAARSSTPTTTARTSTTCASRRASASPCCPTRRGRTTKWSRSSRVSRRRARRAVGRRHRGAHHRVARRDRRRGWTKPTRRATTATRTTPCARAGACRRSQRRASTTGPGRGNARGARAPRRPRRARARASAPRPRFWSSLS